MDRQTATAVQLKPEDYRLLAEFRRLLRQFLVFSEQQALGVGLAPQQHQALLAIKGSPDGPPTVGDLAERLAIRHNSAVGLINRLVPPGQALAMATELARRLSQNAPLAVAATKRVIVESADWPAAEEFARQNEITAPAFCTSSRAPAVFGLTSAERNTSSARSGRGGRPAR